MGNTKQLIVLGNGFDLYCGLSTKYSDYFRHQKAQILNTIKPKNEQSELFKRYLKHQLEQDDNLNILDKQIDEEILNNTKSEAHLANLNWKMMNNYFLEPELENYIKKCKDSFYSKLSFWDVYFIILNKNGIKNWADVESKLAEFLKDSDEEININSFYKYLCKLKSSSKMVQENELFEQLAYFVLLNDENITTDKEIDINWLYNFLKEQLEIFERNLNDYILQLFKPEGILKADTQIGYADNFKDAINKMVSNDDKYNILSFNYTIFPSKRLFEEMHEIYSIDIREDLVNCNIYENIHGRLYYKRKDSKIIIGIDEQEATNESIYMFTKTYQLFELENEQASCLEKGINQIKFFGHSLAQADYSYFQSIFDFYDIYNNDIQLIFYYANYNDAKGNVVDERKNIVKRVTKLMKKYGETLDNKDHGNNLLHKLKLENRISIKKISK